MNTNISKKITLLYAVCFAMSINAAQAAGLNTFSNGTVADADEVNHNFTFLNDRIDNISLTPGPAGSNGTNGTNGTGVVFKSWIDYDNSAYSKKVFIVSGTNANTDKEVRAIKRTDKGDGTGTIDETRQRFLLNVVKRHTVQRRAWDNNGDYAITRNENYDPANTGVRLSTASFSPPIVKLTNSMGVGLRWGSATQITQVFDNSDPDEVSYYIESRSLLGVEDIKVLGITYSACLKIETIRKGNRQKMSWHCPGNVGLVKSIEISNGFTGSSTSVKELDASQSVLIQ